MIVDSRCYMIDYVGMYGYVYYEYMIIRILDYDSR